MSFFFFLSIRNKMKKKKVIRRKTAGPEGSPGGNWSQTGTVIRNQRSRNRITTSPLGEAPTTTFCWSQQVSSDHQKLVFFVTLFLFSEIACKDSDQPHKCVCTNMSHFVKNDKTSQDLMGLLLPYVEKSVFLSLWNHARTCSLSNPPLSSVGLFWFSVVALN